MNKPDMADYRREIAKGDVLLREGDVDGRFFLLEKGCLDVLIQGRKINTIEAKTGQDFVGEIGAILGTPRTATVVAATDCLVLCLPRIEIAAVISASPTLGVKLIQSLCHKLAGSASAFAEFQAADAACSGSGDPGPSLRDYAEGLLWLMERAADDPSGDAARRLHNYFLKTNPWGLRRGDRGCLPGDQARSGPPA
jgi:hypothetical protein